MDKLYQDQLKVWGDIQRLMNNYKKDGADRKKLPDYFKSRLSHLEELWSQFRSNHEHMLKELSKDHKYFKEWEYDRSKASYHSVKEALSQEYQNIIQIETPKASTSASEFETLESAQPQQGFDNDTIEIKGGSEKTKELLRRQIALFSSFNQHCAEFNIDSAENFELMDELADSKARWDEIFQNHIDINVGLAGTFSEYQDKYHEQEKIFRRQRKEINLKLRDITPHEKLTPRIEIPIFNGSFEKWVSFRDLFEQTIHKNSSLSNAEKLQYLKSKLREEPERLIHQLQAGNDNYDACWKIITNRYDNKKHILTSYLNSFMQLPRIEKDNLRQIKKLHDVTLECLNGLKSLGICIEHWDTIIVHILSQKLEYSTYQAYVASLKDPKELPVLKDLMDFLEKTFTALETTSNQPQQSHITKHQPRLNNKPINNKFMSSQVCNRGHDNMGKNTYCKICRSSNHVTFNCKSFTAMNYKERLDTVLGLQICTNCLCNHDVKDCVSAIRCKICYQKHNTKLHNALYNSHSPNRPSTNNLQYKNNYYYPREQSKRVHTTSKDFSEVLLATAKIRVLGANGKNYLMRALIDQGSQISIISEKAAQLLKLKREGCHGVISGVGVNTQRIKGQVTLTCASIHTNYTLKTKGFIMNTLVHKLPNNSFNMPSWPYIKNIELADPEFNRSRQIDILLGADVYSQIMMGGILRGKNASQPIAQQTRLGWILCGNLKSYQCNVILNSTVDLQKFWEIEDIEESPSVVSTEDQYCLELYKQTTLRQANGRYKVRLPLKENFKQSLGLSKPTAVAQFHSLERKLAQQPKTAGQYKDFINEYKDLGHMSLVENKGSEHGYYLPHHCVTREHSETTKLRVVFNGSAKTSTGLSLNDVMYTGPNLQQDLQSLILKWRRFRYVYTADVEKMLRNIDIFECDRKMQKIIWRDTHLQPLQEYELTTVTYGTKAAPFLAMMTLKQLAMDERSRFPRAAEITEQAFYTDDLIYGAHSIEEGCSMVTELQDLLHAGGFTLRKWASNEPSILKRLSEKMNREQNQQIFTFKGDPISKTLGVYWNPKEDCFMFQSSFDFSNKTTKRAFLSDISKLFDPLGWLAPAITAMKIIFQEVWKQNIKWDDQIPTSIIRKWEQFKEELELSISKIRIPRWLQISPDSTVELHGFCDASNKAYAAVIYSRINDKVSLVAAKTKLVPVKGKISIPRGELCGAVLLTKLFSKVKTCLGNNNIKCYGWTDSMVTLGWIQGQPEKWKPFVSNRVKQIVQDMPPNIWRYVKSEENPADCASRGISIKRLEGHSLWWNGPSWLPSYKHSEETQLYFTKEEEKKQYLVNIIQSKDSIVKEIIENCSSFSRAIRIVAWILRLLPKNKDKRERHLTLAEVKEAKLKIISHVQEEEFSYEIEKLKRKESIHKSKLIALNPFLGKDGLLRVGGRLRNAFISEDMQHPILISHTGRLTNLIIDQAHKLTFHGGPRLTLSFIRQKYWIVGNNRAVKRQLRLCVTCVKNNPRLQYQLMGDLPEARCNPVRPFKHTGVDFTGFIMIKSSKGRGMKCTKGYIAVFICMATKAVHLEVVSDLTTSAFLAALKRMAARRGTPEHIYSDNGTNFIGANRVLDAEYDELKRAFASEQFATTITDMEINWHFNAPTWPSAGGLWEAAVKSLKAHTRKVIGDQRFTYEELSTLLAQLETCLNTRPLCPISEDPEDINFLTPAHFLTGGPTLSLLPTESDLRTRWYLVEKTFQDIWKRWQAEYLPTLTSRSKWQRPRENLKVQDLVAIHDPNLPPGKWAMGRVVELHPGTDNIVRVVSLKTKNGIIKRPIVKLSPLPVQDSNKAAVENKEPHRSVKPRPVGREVLGNVLTIMLSFIYFLTYVSATHPANYNISTFNNNKGVYLDKISNMQLVQEKWKIIVYYDMNPYWEGEKAFEQYYKTLNGMCAGFNEKTHCEITMNQLRHGFAELKYYDQVLLTQHPGTRSKRRRRGLINGIGYAAHSLFGVLDESFAEQYQKDISLVKENEQHLANLWKNQTSVLEAEYNLMKRSEEENYNLRKLINRHANEVKKAIDTQVTEINNLERITQFTLDSIAATNVLANLKNMQEYLIDTITDIYHGRFNFHLISSEQLRKELNIISNHISTDLSLPITNSQAQFGNIYKFLRVRARMLYEQLILEISVPLVSRDNFEIYNVISVPYKSDALTMVKVVPISDLVAINKEKNSYIKMSENQLLSNCDYYSDIYYCNLPKLFHHMKAEDSLCKTGIKGQCQFEKVPCDNEWIDLNKKNTYLYFCCDRCPLHVICGDQISAEQLNTTGLISIGHGCMLRNKKGVIYAHNDYQNMLKTETMVYSPYMDSINNLINVSLSSDVIENSRNNYTISSLDKIGVDLEHMRKEAPVISEVTYHDVHQYIALYSILGIFVVVGAILLLRRFRRTSTVVPVQQTSSGITMMPMQQPTDVQQETSVAALAAAVAASLAVDYKNPIQDRTPVYFSASDSAV